MARGSLRKRSSGSWTIIVDLGYRADPKTGKRKRRQKWETVRGSKQKAEQRLTELLRSLDTNDYFEPTDADFGQWLKHWFEVAVEGRLRPRSCETYLSIIDNHLTPELGAIPLADLEPVHIEQYYRSKSRPSGRNRALSQRTLETHHCIISAALKSALKKGYVSRNVAQLIDNRPRWQETETDPLKNVWTPEEARSFLAAARDSSAQEAAFYALALDTGARKGELCGLRWKNVDLEAETVRIVEQILRAGSPPLFSPPKKGGPRKIRLSRETAALLREHRSAQNRLKLANRKHYQDFGLAFAKDYGDRTRNRDRLGEPLAINNIGQRSFARLTKAAGVKKITFHGMRHTSATLLLAAGVHPKIVSERLGHKSIQITLDLYSHVLPSMQEEAAVRLGDILHGSVSNPLAR